MKKALCLLLMLFMLIPFAVACKDNESTSVAPVYIDGYEFNVLIDDITITATQINSTPEGDNVVIYTRDYKRGGSYSLTVNESQEGRCALSIRCTQSGGNTEFDVVERTDDVASAQIPYNGFVITMPSGVLDDVRVNKGTVVEVEGYESAVSNYERLDLAVFNPGYLSGTASRRISFVNPINDFTENKIYYIDDEFEGARPISIDNVVVSLKRKTANNYEVITAGKASEVKAPSNGEVKLVFTGEYNIAYATHYLKEAERVSFSMISSANEFTDIPAIVSGDKVIAFEDKFVNAEAFDAEGAYLFDANYDAAATPATDKKRVDVVVVEDVVSQVTEEGKRTLVPGGNGFVVSFVGEDAAKEAENFIVGAKAETYYIEYSDLPEQYVRIGNEFFGIDKINTVRAPEGVAVLYTDNYGKSTGANEYGVEIVVKDDKVSGVYRSAGDAEIPEGGFVLSIHKSNSKYIIANKIKVGEEVTINLSGTDYNVTTLEYTGTNTTRGEDSLIIYNGKDGKNKSGTNEFGYEIAVDKDGYAIEESYSGNLDIPEGGFVISGHGVNKTALVDAFVIGERILLDTKKKTATIIETPELKLSSAKYNFAAVSDKMEEAKKAYLNIDYKLIDSQMALISDMITEAEKAFEEYDFEKALSNAASVITNCQQMRYSMIESKSVENRAVWYRSTEKSDAEVRAVIEKMKSLNVNAVYLETWYEGYCIGKQVEIDGITTHSNNGDYDVLEGFVRIGHEYGIEVHAWVQNFFVGFYYEGGNAYYNPTFSPENYGDKYLIDCKGKKNFYYSANDNYFIFLNSNDRECRDLILNIYEQLITKYDIDGLHLDYIRYPELNYGTDDFGYNQDIIDAFAKKTGITGDPRLFADNSAEEKAWIQFRCDIITSFVGEVYDMVRENNSDIWLSAATYPDIELSKNTIAQDIVAFVEKGYLDEVFSMSYGVENKTVMTSVNDYLEITKGNAFYSVGIAAFLETTQLNFAYQLTDVELAGADGVSVFSLNSISPDTYQNQMTDGAFRSPAVQVYELSLTAAAQMDYICGKVDNISYICDALTADDISYIKSKCGEIKEFSEGFELDSATNGEKIKWCKEALAMIASAKADIIAECGDNAETQAVICEFEDLEYWLTLTAERLETR